MPDAALIGEVDDTPAWLLQSTDALRLAAWTHLDFVAFAGIYITITNGIPAAARWETLGTSLSPNASPTENGKSLIGAACTEAEARGFLDRLAYAVVYTEINATPRAVKDGGELLNAITTSGEMQTIVDAARGFMSVEVLPAAFQAAQACAVVYQGQEPIGTAFLVRPDLVVTAAHVVLAVEQDANGKEVWSDKLRPDLKFSFRSAPGDPRLRDEVWPATRDTPVAFARPNGDPPNKLRSSLFPPADKNLDFAYVQLARKITHVREIDISAPVAPQANDNCFVIGYPGGNDLMMDVKQIESVDLTAGRMLHRINTVPGMSGGCCVGREGTVIGLHEGSLPVMKNGKQETDANGKPQFLNRGICLANIRAGQQGATDPLANRRGAQEIEMNDPAVVRTLYHTGLRFAGPDLAEAWRSLVQAMLDLPNLPGDGTTFPAFQPWFKRNDLETWTDSRKPVERLCYVYGDEGAGKSFSVEILRAKLSNPTIDLVTLNGTQTGNWSWEEAIAPLFTLHAPQFRSEAGAIRYDDVPAIVQQLGQIGGVARTTANPLFVAVDFDRVGVGVRFGRSPWLTFIEALARQEWARVMLIGLTDDERDGVDTILDTIGLSAVLIRLSHLGVPELKAYLKTLLRSRGLSLDPQVLSSKIQEIRAQPMFLSQRRPTLQTIETALAAIAFERLVAHD